ncbi:MAG: glycosyltransferase [Candidatus Dormibacteria bacterium]
MALISVHSCPYSEIGGGENGGMSVYIRSVTEAMSRRGVPTYVFTRREYVGAPQHRDMPEGCHLVHIDAGPPEPLDKNMVFEYLPEFVANVAAWARAEGIEFRVVHSHYWLSGWVGRRLGQLWGIPWLHMAHTWARVKDRDRPPGAARESPQRVGVEEEIVRDCNRLVAPTAQEVEDMAVLYGSGRECIAIIPPGVDAEVFRPTDSTRLRASLGIPQGRKVILFTGRLERLKGLETLVFALASIDAQDPDLDVELLVLGADSSNGRLEAAAHGGERARIASLAADLGVAQQVRFLGTVPHDDLPTYYSLADVCCVPSYSESFGLVAIESQACQTPVVASRVGGLRQLVLDGITGYTIARHDPGDYADALLKILRDPQLAAVMGVAGRRLAQAYGWDATADRLLDVYDEVESEYSRAAAALLG